MKKLSEDWTLSRILESDDREREADAAPPRLAREARQLAALREDLGKLGHEKPPADLNAAIMQRVQQTEPRHWIYLFLFRPRHVLLRTSVASAVTAAALLCLITVLAYRFVLSAAPGTWSDMGQPEPPSAAVAPTHPLEPAAGYTVEKGQEPSLDEAKRNVHFTVHLPEASKVRLVGDFNEWSDKGIVLHGPGDDGSWSVDLDLEPGKYQYMFVVDEAHWIADENADAWVDDGFGHVNSVMVVM